MIQEAVIQHTLTISTTAGGTTDPIPGGYGFISGTQVNVDANPYAGYKFSHWTGDIPSGHENDNPVTIVMDSNKSITVHFAANNSPSNYQVLTEAIWADAGYGGTWMTEAQITDISGGSQVSVYFDYGGGNCRGLFLLWTAPSADNSVKFNNLPSSIDAADPGAFDYYGRLGAVEFVTQDAAHRIHVTARVLNGDYSKTSAGLNGVEANTADATREMMVQNFTSDGTYRSAIGCFNPTGDSVMVKFELIDGGGNVIGSAFTKTFAGYDQQSFDPFTEARRPYPAYAYDNVHIRISPVSGAGRVMCFGATANNASNDPAAHFAVQRQ